MTGTISRGRGGVSRAAKFGTLITLVTSTAVIAACDRDAPTGLRAVDRSPQRVVEVSATSAYDEGINPYDSYVEQVQVVAETTTVTTTEPFNDPNTGQLTYSTTVGTEPQPVNVSAGYGYDGQPRITNGFRQSAPEETTWLRRVTDVTTDRRSDGSDTAPMTYDPMSELGTLQDAYLDVGGGGSAGGGGGCTQVTGCAALRTGDDSVAIHPLGASGPFFRGIAGARHRRVTASHGAVRIEETFSNPTPSAGLLDLTPTRSSAQTDTKIEQKLTREYEMRDGEWQLKHSVHETITESSDAKLRLIMHFTVLKSKIHRNKEKDAERSHAAGITSVSAAPSVATTIRLAGSVECDPTTSIIPCSDQPVPLGSDEPLHVDPTLATAPASWQAAAGTGPAVVLQHGFMSSAATWARMEWWLRRDVPIKGTYRSTTPWEATYENQAGALHQAVAATLGNTPTIVIGHSNGGMVGRYLGRHPDAWNVFPAANINTVITVGTPHYGAPFAKDARNIKRLIGLGGMTGALLCRWSHTAGCRSWNEIRGSQLDEWVNALTQNAPVLSEMQPMDLYHQRFNGETESFRRFGVASNMWTRWMPWRLYGDVQCWPESNCGGTSHVRKADRIYKRDIGCAIVGAFVGRYDAALRCTADAVFLRGVDELFRRFVQFGGDGVVPGWSQKYPFIPEEDNYQVTGKDAPSHLGETESPRIGNRIEQILVNRLRLGGSVRLPA